MKPSFHRYFDAVRYLPPNSPPKNAPSAAAKRSKGVLSRAHQVILGYPGTVPDYLGHTPVGTRHTRVGTRGHRVYTLPKIPLKPPLSDASKNLPYIRLRKGGVT